MSELLNDAFYISFARFDFYWNMGMEHRTGMIDTQRSTSLNSRFFNLEYMRNTCNLKLQKL